MSNFDEEQQQASLKNCLNPNCQCFNPSQLLQPNEVSAAIGVTTGTLSVWRSTGRYGLRYVKCGRLVRYRASDVLNFLEERTFGKEEKIR